MLPIKVLALSSQGGSFVHFFGNCDFWRDWYFCASWSILTTTIWLIFKLRNLKLF